MKKKKLIKKLSFEKKEISKLSDIHGGAIPAQGVATKTNDARCFSRVDTCLCMTVGVCPINQNI